ncbi:MAG: hypothetical protein ACOY3P_21975 [Planctomycetota bacterium]
MRGSAPSEKVYLKVSPEGEGFTPSHRETVNRYGQVRRAIAAKEAELKEIYDIQRSASTLLAFIETHERKRDEMQRELEAERAQLQQDIETTRAAWDDEIRLHDQSAQERKAADEKRRQREQDEFKYVFAREQQLARDQFNDEMARQQKELAERKAALEQEWSTREKAIAAAERELSELRARVAGLPTELAAATDRAAKDAVERMQMQHAATVELMKREFEGEKSVLSTKIAALERTAKEQSEHLTRLQQQAEKAYVQVQEIAVRAIEGSGSNKQFAALQQMLAEQARRPT